MTSRLHAGRRFLHMSLGTAITLGMLASPTLALAQVSFEVLHTFAGFPDDGAKPFAGLVQASDNALYGTTVQGGSGHDFGTVFRITLDGEFALMHTFNAGDGREPLAPLVDDGAGRLWGTTVGNMAGGEVFAMNADGSVQLVAIFDGQFFGDGTGPRGAVVRAGDGNWYGTTLVGDRSSGFPGAVFRVPGTAYRGHDILHRFSGADGAIPEAALIQASDGNLYGTTSGGGDFGLGTIFQMTLDGALTTVHSFTGADGANPLSALLQASDGHFYGTTDRGGDFDLGTIFQMTRDGVLTVLYSFSGPDGANPGAPLIQASDGTFYGTTANGGDFDQGLVFQMTSDGALLPIYVFAGHSDGGHPVAAILEADDGNLYGTTSAGGSAGFGTVFRLNVASQ
jgi:uncharacterized repeat protein (TIGR03803 family)